MTVEITTPVGRLVWGVPTKSQGKTRKDPVTGQFVPVMKDGVQVQQWAFGVAFPKADFLAHIWPAMLAETCSVYPPTAATGGQPSAPPKFAYKYKDGDGIDDQGKPYNLREGYAGCYVLTVSTELQAPPIFKNVNGAYQQLPPDAIKCGDYISCGLNLKANVPVDRTMTPGLYVNPTAIEFVGYGSEIVSQGSADPNAIFKGAVHQLPPGASAAPAMQPGAPGMPGMGMTPGAIPMAAPAPMMAPPAPMAAPAAYAPPPPAAPPVAAAMARPVDPSHIQPNPAGGEFWWNGAAWVPGVAAPIAPTLPPPATNFIPGAPAPMMAPPAMPGMPAPR